MINHPAEDSLAAGKRVVLIGLQGKYNNLEGNVIRYDAQEYQWVVELRETRETMLVSAENLMVIKSAGKNRGDSGIDSVRSVQSVANEEDQIMETPSRSRKSIDVSEDEGLITKTTAHPQSDEGYATKDTRVTHSDGLVRSSRPSTIPGYGPSFAPRGVTHSQQTNEELQPGSQQMSEGEQPGFISAFQEGEPPDYVTAQKEIRRKKSIEDKKQMEIEQPEPGKTLLRIEIYPRETKNEDCNIFDRTLLIDEGHVMFVDPDIGPFFILKEAMKEIASFFPEGKASKNYRQLVQGFLSEGLRVSGIYFCQRDGNYLQATSKPSLKDFKVDTNVECLELRIFRTVTISQLSQERPDPVKFDWRLHTEKTAKKLVCARAWPRRKNRNDLQFAKALVKQCSKREKFINKVQNYNLDNWENWTHDEKKGSIIEFFEKRVNHENPGLWDEVVSRNGFDQHCDEFAEIIIEKYSKRPMVELMKFET